MPWASCCRPHGVRVFGAILAVVLFLEPGLASSGDRSWVFQSCLAHCSSSGCTRLPHVPVSEQQALGIYSCPAACASALQAGHKQPGMPGASPVPLPLRLFRWSCEDDCKYHCMEAVEAWKARAGGQQEHGGSPQLQRLPVEKYHGKWPFRRVAGMQELLSVLASLANLAAHAVCLARLRARAGRGVSRVPSLPPSAGMAATRSPGGVGTGGLDGALCRLPYPFLGLWTAYSALHLNAWLWRWVVFGGDR